MRRSGVSLKCFHFASHYYRPTAILTGAGYIAALADVAKGPYRHQGHLPFRVIFSSKVPYFPGGPAPMIKVSLNNKNEVNIMWTKPAYTDLRIGFEVTMYFANR